MFLFYILFFLVEIDGKTFVKDGFSVIAKSNLHASGVKNGFWDSLLPIIRKSKNKLRSYDVLQESIFRHLYMKYATYQNSNCSGKLCLPNHLLKYKKALMNYCSGLHVSSLWRILRNVIPQKHVGKYSYKICKGKYLGSNIISYSVW